MNILVACEESQRVCMAFREKGHRAFSADIQECSGGHPEWHILGDVIPLINGNCNFTLQNRERERQDDKWDMLIAFPPCTHLAVSGARHFEVKRADGRQREAIEFFMQFINADCERISVENPVNIMSGNYISKWFPDLQEKYGLPIKPTQTIEPWMFGHRVSKKTCLWLKGLPKLLPTKIVDPGDYVTAPSGRRYNVGSGSAAARDENGKIIAWNDPRTGKIRSKTYEGIALAMSEQWGENPFIL